MKILITGASNGVGFDAARELALRGHEVWAGGRFLADVSYLERYGAHVFAMDIRDAADREAAIDRVGTVDILINSAGFGGYADPGDKRANFDVTVFGMEEMTKLVIPGMLMASDGRIINVSAISGRSLGDSALWMSTAKYAVEALSTAMNTEYAPEGIDVLFVAPDAEKTNLGTASCDTATSSEIDDAVFSQELGVPPAAIVEICAMVEEFHKQAAEQNVAEAAPQTDLPWQLVDVLYGSRKKCPEGETQGTAVTKI